VRIRIDLITAEVDELYYNGAFVLEDFLNNDIILLVQKNMIEATNLVTVTVLIGMMSNELALVIPESVVED
jgi:hypothetical protein